MAESQPHKKAADFGDRQRDERRGPRVFAVTLCACDFCFLGAAPGRTRCAALAFIRSTERVGLTHVWRALNRERKLDVGARA